MTSTSIPHLAKHHEHAIVIIGALASVVGLWAFMSSKKAAPSTGATDPNADQYPASSGGGIGGDGGSFGNLIKSLEDQIANLQPKNLGSDVDFSFGVDNSSNFKSAATSGTAGGGSTGVNIGIPGVFSFGFGSGKSGSKGVTFAEEDVQSDVFNSAIHGTNLNESEIGSFLSFFEKMAGNYSQRQNAAAARQNAQTDRLRNIVGARIIGDNPVNNKVITK